MEEFTAILLENLTPGKLVGHLSYMLLVLSMLMRTMTRLRIVAISAGVVSAIYGWFWLKDLVTVFWETVFVTTNLVQLMILAWENKRASFNKEEQRFVDVALKDVEKAHARRLLRRGKWQTAESGTVLIKEGDISSHLIFLTEGAVSIEKDSRIIAVCGHEDFLGEMSFMSGKPANATAVVANSVRYLSFERNTLQAALDRDKEVRHAIEASFNRNLAEKLSKSNEAGLRADDL
ncbi:MAG: cyclic nucleotide-binding domain-containing protein [Pseudomonadota bacterium]